ncbi:rab-GTPase-TBC domain-containing protein [Geopyxis carbonaria]|nr:rab-GTPase-TBC domain-containing protein [Geopyxis carbonaria]
MRTMHDARKRWNFIFEEYNSIAALRQAALQQGPHNPCASGLRSICWKLFLVCSEFAPESWLVTLNSQRNTYSQLCEEHLKLLHEESALGAPDIDPLAEDDSNPWEKYRKDDELRREIFQDIERCMPDNHFFRDPKIQSSLLNILFVYCKLNQDVSYRQGFHEIAAVIFWVVWCDSVYPDTSRDHACETLDTDKMITEALDFNFIEHDTFTLFQTVMYSAKAWYELGDGDFKGQQSLGSSPIVQKSKYIHETLLMVTDPELGNHLKELDVLPQVFLIRWIRLLFSREFPFEELLVVWDYLFAEDTDLHLVDLVCVAMLLRIRWQLMEADYSTALTLVLRYPSPHPPSLPVTFVEDAVYLRDNLSTEGGKYIIRKYSSRVPVASTPSVTQPIRSSQRIRRPMSPHGKIESIVQDVAKNVFDRSEKWGFNRAVQEAVVEVRKNVSGYQQHQTQRQSTTKEEELEKQNLALSKRLKSEEERRRQLARILELGINVLNSEGYRTEDSLYRLHHVKECLLDDSKPLNKGLLHPSPMSPLSSSAIDQKITTPPRKDEAQKKVDGPSQLASFQPSGNFVKTSFKNNSDPDFLSHAERPRTTLAQSSFAWMLGEDPATKNRIGFIEPTKSSAGATKKTNEVPKGVDLKYKASVVTQDDTESEGFDLGDFRRTG